MNMKKQERFVIAVYRDGHPSRMVIRDSRPLAVKEFELIGKIRDADRERVKSFLEEKVDRVSSTLSCDWTSSGWIQVLTED